MAMVHLYGLKSVLTVDGLRANLGPSFRCGGKTFIWLEPSHSNGKCVAEGIFRMYVEGRTWQFPCAMYLCDCRVPFLHQAISLKKTGSYVGEDLYRVVDGVLLVVLQRLLPRLLGAEIAEFEVVESKGGEHEVAVGAWGPQHCDDFRWSAEAQALMAGGRTLHRWCSRCVFVGECSMAVTYSANRRR